MIYDFFKNEMRNVFRKHFNKYGEILSMNSVVKQVYMAIRELILFKTMCEIFILLYLWFRHLDEWCSYFSAIIVSAAIRKQPMKKSHWWPGSVLNKMTVYMFWKKNYYRFEFHIAIQWILVTNGCLSLSLLNGIIAYLNSANEFPNICTYGISLPT